MRRIALAFALAAAPLAAAAATLGIPLDQSIRVGLPVPAHDIIIGNPNIADVTVPDQSHLVVTGKSAGVTNLIVTDAAGHTIFNREIVVSASAGSHVALINGPMVVSYACAPACAQIASEGAVPAPASTATVGPTVSAPAPGRGAIQASPNLP
jgi:Flp pilus assembly secretin CpaC